MSQGCEFVYRAKQQCRGCFVNLLVAKDDRDRVSKSTVGVDAFKNNLTVDPGASIIECEFIIAPEAGIERYLGDPRFAGVGRTPF